MPCPYVYFSFLLFLCVSVAKILPAPAIIEAGCNRTTASDV